MFHIQALVADAHINDDITEDNARDIAMNFVRETYGQEDAPTELVIARELAQRADIIKAILMAAASRLRKGQRTSLDLCDEISQRESEVCRLVARGEIDIHRSEVQ